MVWNIKCKWKLNFIRRESLLLWMILTFPTVRTVSRTFNMHAQYDIIIFSHALLISSRRLHRTIVFGVFARKIRITTNIADKSQKATKSCKMNTWYCLFRRVVSLFFGWFSCLTYMLALCVCVSVYSLACAFFTSR